MTAEERKQHVLDLITGATPGSFWRGFQDRARGLYQEAFASVGADTQLNNKQRLSKLYQERHFKMEWLLVDEATQHGITASDQVISRNRCAYAYAGAGPLGFTQKYVGRSGEMPSPAKFRKQLAAANSFAKQPALLFGEAPDELRKPKAINGIVLHSPWGGRFEEEHQKLGAIGFYVPFEDHSSWAVELTFAEIIASYAAEEEREDRVRPRLRVAKKAMGEA